MALYILNDSNVYSVKNTVRDIHDKGSQPKTDTHKNAASNHRHRFYDRGSAGCSAYSGAEHVPDRADFILQ